MSSHGSGEPNRATAARIQATRKTTGKTRVPLEQQPALTYVRTVRKDRNVRASADSRHRVDRYILEYRDAEGREYRKSVETSRGRAPTILPHGTNAELSTNTEQWRAATRARAAAPRAPKSDEQRAAEWQQMAERGAAERAAMEREREAVLADAAAQRAAEAAKSPEQRAAEAAAARAAVEAQLNAALGTPTRPPNAETGARTTTTTTTSSRVIGSRAVKPRTKVEQAQYDEAHAAPGSPARAAAHQRLLDLASTPAALRPLHEADSAFQRASAAARTAQDQRNHGYSNWTEYNAARKAENDARTALTDAAQEFHRKWGVMAVEAEQRAGQRRLEAKQAAAAKRAATRASKPKAPRPSTVSPRTAPVTRKRASRKRATA
jgi:hypothetical protein